MKRAWVKPGIVAAWFGWIAALLLLPQSAVAQPAPMIVENVSIPGGLYSFKIPRIEIRGANFSKDDLQAVLTGKAPQPFSQRLAAMSFSEAAIPELIQETNLAGDTSRTIYKDVKLSNATNGVIGSIVSSSAAFESRTEIQNAKTGKPETTAVSGSFDKISIENLDIAASVRVFGEVSDVANAPVSRIYSSYNIENVKMGGSVQNGKIAFSAASVTGQNFRARPSKTGLFEFAAIAKDNPEIEDMDDDEKQQFFSSLLLFFANLDFGAAQIKDLAMAIDIDEPARTNPNEPGSVALKVASMRIGDADANLRLEGIAMTIPQESVVIGLQSYEIKGFSLQPTLDRLKEMVDAGKFSEDAWKEVDPRDFMPVFGTVAINGFSLTGPKMAEAFSLASQELTLGNQIKGVPTSFSYRLTDLVIPIPADSDDPQIAMLKDLGIKRLNLSATIASNWDEASKEFRISEISAREEKLGSIRFTGIIGNVQKEFFTSSLSTVQILALALTARQAEIRFENGGIVDLLVKDRSRTSGKPESEFRAEVIATLKRDLTAAIGDVPAAHAVVEGATKLLNGGRTMTIKVTARNALGLGMMDFIAAAKPAEVIEKVDVEVTNE